MLSRTQQLALLKSYKHHTEGTLSTMSMAPGVVSMAKRRPKGKLIAAYNCSNRSWSGEGPRVSSVLADNAASGKHLKLQLEWLRLDKYCETKSWAAVDQAAQRDGAVSILGGFQVSAGQSYSSPGTVMEMVLIPDFQMPLPTNFLYDSKKRLLLISLACVSQVTKSAAKQSHGF